MKRFVFLRVQYPIRINCGWDTEKMEECYIMKKRIR